MNLPAILSPKQSPPVAGPPARLCVLASGSGSNFAAISDAIERGELNARICCVIHNVLDAGVVARASERAVPSVFVDHRAYKSRQAFDACIVQLLSKHAIDWVIMAGWMRLCTDVLLDAYEGRILNIHPSLLPSFGGLRAVEQALAAGVKISGCTVHVVTAAMDAGPIIAQAAVAVESDDTARSLHARIQVQEHRLYPIGINLALGLSISKT
ncbi:MAG: phosphoribosylglycinamide formyltransferase [Bradymonadaceae bacterium]|nr:phosphoribosylglycinamide formyltransferase [Lujinxingiaceae bacterium]